MTRKMRSRFSRYPAESRSRGRRRMADYLAMIAAWVEKDLAREQLAMAIGHSSDLSYGQLKLLPFWDPLRGNPRFEEIVASLEPK